MEEKKELDKNKYGSAFSQYTKVLIGNMENADGTADTAAEYFAMRAASKIGDYYHENEDIQDFIRKDIENIKGSLKLITKKFIQEALVHGFSGIEIVWQLQQSKIRTKELVSFNTENCIYDRESEVFNQENTIIPRDKMIIYIRDSSKMDKIRKLLRIKRYFLEFWGKYIENFVSPLVVGEGEDPDEMLKAIDNLYFKKAVTVGTGEKVYYLQANVGGSGEIQKAMEYIDKLVYRVFHLGGSFSAGEKSGTVQNSDVNKEMFEEATDWVAEEVRELLLEEWIRKVVEYNFGNQENYGEFKLDSGEELDKKLIYAQILEILQRIGIITFEDYEDIRKKLNLGVK